MTEKDQVVSGLTASQDKIVFEMDELYNVAKQWCKLNRYSLYEKAIEQEVTPDGKEEMIKWIIERKVDNHMKFQIRIIFKINGINVNVKKKGKAVKGGISFDVDSWVEVDYDKDWDESPLFKFMRDIYNRFILGDKYDKYSDLLKKDTHDVYNELRAFLDLHIGR